MFATTLRCYELGVFSVGARGILRSEFQREVEVSRSLNPGSDYWHRKDLYKGQ